MIYPDGYYDRTDESKNYTQHLFIAGRCLQAAELNEVQVAERARRKNIADALFKDGDIRRDAQVVVNQDTGVVSCQAGVVYLRGDMWGVPPATLTVSLTGTVAIGVRLLDEVVTEEDDPTLLDPAIGERAYSEAGAMRLRTTPSWSLDDGSEGEFFPVYTITDGQLNAKEPPPNVDAFAQSLSRYDRDSSGGCYVVSGMTVKALNDVGGNQVYTIAEGRARVYGYGVEYPTARRVTLAATPDLKSISTEPHISTTAGLQRINFNRVPGANISAVSITAEKTVTLTHGISTGAQDPLPDTSVLQIVSVVQGGTTYTPTTDYILNADKVDWSPGGAEPAPGSTYNVTYRYLTLTTPLDVDDNGFSVQGAVSGTAILVSYQQKLPRIDRLCLNQDGVPVWVLGISADYNPQPPSVPGDMLALARVYQTWTNARTVTNDGVRMVPMQQIAAIDTRLDWLAQLIAANRLESSIHTREGGTKKGLFVDPFLDDSQRDAGIAQTAAITQGLLCLPIAASIHQMGSDISAPATLPYTMSPELSQLLSTGSIQVNPYMAFEPVPAGLSITPNVDRWTNVSSSWASPVTSRFVVGSGDQSSTTATTRTALLSTTTSDDETLRSITVNYVISRFGPGEILSSLTFDGVSVLSGSPVADSNGVVAGSFTVPAGIPSGTKLVVATGASGAVARATYTGQGTLERQVWQQQTTITERRWQSPPVTPPAAIWPVDPIAETFMLETNRQIGGVNLWFSAKPTTETSVQIRTTANGYPDQNVVASAVLQPSAISAGGATTFSFAAPVSLVAGTEYAIVVLCNDATGTLAIAELGKFDAAAQKWVTSQPYTVGVLLSSSNASTWTAHQDRDLKFQLLGADYSAPSRTISLGSVSLVGITDLMLMSYAERPHSTTAVQYRMTLPDGSVLYVDDGQPVQLAAPITGAVSVEAILTGSAAWSPVLFPGTQLVAGVCAPVGDYVTRAIPGGSSVTVKAIIEAIVPSGATLDVEYKGQDAGDTWASLTQTSSRAVDDGFTEFIFEQTGVNEVNGVQIRLTLNGNTAARPRVRDLRTMVI